MHLQIIVRGVISQVQLWESMMQNHHFKWRRINLKTKKEEIVLVQGGLRPSVLGTYEFVFPEESLPTVLSMMGITEGGMGFGIERTLMNKAKLATLRKICGVKKIPKSAFEKAKKIESSVYFKDGERGLSHMKVHGVSIHPIGIKEDKRIKMYDPVDKKEYWQEAL